MSRFRVSIDRTLCKQCMRCVTQCTFGAIEAWRPPEVPGEPRWHIQSIPRPKDSLCAGCLRCEFDCPFGAITVGLRPPSIRPNGHWSESSVSDIYQQAEHGKKLLSGSGSDSRLPAIWDRLLLDACQVTNPPIDPLREPMETVTFLGGRRDTPPVRLGFPVMFAAMSYGAVSLNVQKALVAAAARHGTLMNCGEGGLAHELREQSSSIVVQCASGRFGVDLDYLNAGAAVEIKVGQGAKPGIGGHLPGEKVTESIARTRMIPEGSDAISPAPHHDVYSIEDIRQLIYAVKEATGYSRPVGVKVAAVHNISSIASGLARAGADFISIDGFRGGTGAAPRTLRDNFGLPLELAIAAVDDRLRHDGLREDVTIIASGGIRSAADVLKAIALGADIAAVSTAALVALGCHLCQMCYTGKCAWGITTQRPDLVERLEPSEATERLSNLLGAWKMEMEEMLGALGINAIESLRSNRDRLRAVEISECALKVLGVAHAGA
ncbi:MAG: FMN-binding glutamate synthase family protein [Firmicutes bacterium]|nr:FMN-binding glutamate synthase family protein [Bacillota bacterium]